MAADYAEPDHESSKAPPLPRRTAETEVDLQDEGTGTQHPAPGSLDDEAPSSSAHITSSRDEVPAFPSTTAEATVPAAEAMLMSVLAGITERNLSQSVQPAETAEPFNRLAARVEASTAPQEPTASEPTSSAVIRGIVDDAPDAATWILVSRTIRLWGIEPRSHNAVASLVKWVRGKGPVECVPRAKTGRYQCYMATGEDIAEAALLAGVARAGDPAPAVYHNAEAQARRKGKGQWERR
jgi:endonuclease YncB( thermonuclease family)